MIKHIRKLLGLCDHKWETIREGPLLSKDNTVVGHYYIVRCETCGHIKQIEP